MSTPDLDDLLAAWRSEIHTTPAPDWNALAVVLAMAARQRRRVHCAVMIATLAVCATLPVASPGFGGSDPAAVLSAPPVVAAALGWLA
jgi:hypothetical protein